VRTLHDKLRKVNKGWPNPPSPNVIAYHKIRPNNIHDTLCLSVQKDWLASWMWNKKQTLFLALFTVF
jgi:hypothetical protein